MKVVITKARPLLVALLTGCANDNKPSSEARSEATNELHRPEPHAITKIAWQYLANLAAKGQLPWLADGETVKLDSEEVVNLPELEFPIVRRFFFRKADGSICRYQVVKQTRQAE